MSEKKTCNVCGHVLTDLEVEFYETTCNDCETYLMAHGDYPDSTVPVVPPPEGRHGTAQLMKIFEDIKKMTPEEFFKWYDEHAN